jgi:hypothetical protein
VRGETVKKWLCGISYGAFVGWLSALLVLLPSAEIRAQGVEYSRVVDAAARSANRQFSLDEIIEATATSAARGRSLLIKRVASGVGWVGLGVSIGTLIYEIYLSQQEMQQLAQMPSDNVQWQNNLGDWVVGTISGPGQWTTPDGRVLKGSTGNAVAQHCQQPDVDGNYSDWEAGPYASLSSVPNWGQYWEPHFYAGFGTTDPARGYYMCHLMGFSNFPVPAPSVVGTPQQIVDKLKANNYQLAGDYLNDAHTYPMGLNHEATRTAMDVVAQPVLPEQITTTIIPESQVSLGDSEVARDLPAPSGSQQTSNTSTSTSTNPDGSTATTNTTTNPDGATTTETNTDTDPEPEQVTCTVGQSDMRDLGGILRLHVERWQGGPLVGSLSSWQNIVWPTALPVVSFSSWMFGSFSMDLNAWAWVFAAVRVVVIGGATLYAYRLVFG